MPIDFDIVTFDCYGTLIDWESGISEAFIAAAWSDGFTFARDEVLRAYAEAERAVESERYVPYREVLTQSAVRAARAIELPELGRSRGSVTGPVVASVVHPVSESAAGQRRPGQNIVLVGRIAKTLDGISLLIDACDLGEDVPQLRFFER